MRREPVPELPIADVANAEIASRTLCNVAKGNSSIWVLTADVMGSTKTKLFATAFPERFIDVGIAEQTMMGIAAGLATCGKVPFAACFAAMASMRACEQIRTDIAYPNLNVKIVVTHSGFAVGTAGPTHHATEDIAIMRSMANMTVIVPCDVHETREAVLGAIDRPGPVYIRMGRNPEPLVYSGRLDYRIGRAIQLRDGSDITLIGCGRTVSECIIAAELLATSGVTARILDMHTIKPIDFSAIAQAVAKTRVVFTVEEHSIIGGLGAAVAEVMAELGCSVPLRRIGLLDIYGAIGSQEALLDKYGLTGPRIADMVLRTVRELP